MGCNGMLYMQQYCWHIKAFCRYSNVTKPRSDFRAAAFISKTLLVTTAFRIPNLLESGFKPIVRIFQKLCTHVPETSMVHSATSVPTLFEQMQRRLRILWSSNNDIEHQLFGHAKRGKPANLRAHRLLLRFQHHYLSKNLFQPISYLVLLGDVR